MYIGRKKRHCPRNGTGWSYWKETHDSLSGKGSPRKSVRDSHRLSVFSARRPSLLWSSDRTNAEKVCVRNFIVVISRETKTSRLASNTRLRGGLNFVRILEIPYVRWAAVERIYGDKCSHNENALSPINNRWHEHFNDCTRPPRTPRDWPIASPLSLLSSLTVTSVSRVVLPIDFHYGGGGVASKEGYNVF